MTFSPICAIIVRINADKSPFRSWLDNDPSFLSPWPFISQGWKTMARNNQNLLLDNSETAQFLELQNVLNKDGSKRSPSQVVDYALRVAMANAKAASNADFRDRGELFSDPFERTI